jgi:hypothetical protein
MTITCKGCVAFTRWTADYAAIWCASLRADGTCQIRANLELGPSVVTGIPVRIERVKERERVEE